MGLAGRLVSRAPVVRPQLRSGTGAGCRAGAGCGAAVHSATARWVELDRAAVGEREAQVLG